MQKIMIVLIVLVVGLLLNVTTVSAHAVVKPAQVGVGSFTDFSLGVPSEKEVATTMVKLTLPSGLNNVSPIVKAGWKIEVKTSTANGQPDDDGNIKPTPVEIDWTGGQVPVGQKDFFMFSAQVPTTPGELDWKVEQTYADGSIVSWTIPSTDQQPKDASGKLDFSKFGPLSKTMVVNDLKPAATSTNSMGNVTQNRNYGNTISLVALVLSVISIVWQLRERKRSR